VVIDGRSQSESMGPFKWRRRPGVRLREWHSTAELYFLDAEHDAYCGLTDPVVHRRRIVFMKPRYWIVVDDLIGAAEHKVELVFQFAPVRVTLEPCAWTRVETPAGAVLWLSVVAAVPIRSTLRTGGVRPLRGWLAPNYGLRLPAPNLVYSVTGTLPRRLLTLLVPDSVVRSSPRSSPPAVRFLRDEQGEPAGVVFEASGESVRVDERAIVHVGA